MLNQRHVRPLTRFVEQIRREQPSREVPYFDPLDGGIDAHCLYVLEAPGRMTNGENGSGFVSRNNNDETAKNFFEVNKSAGIPRRKTITWNIVPWYIGNDGRRRKPNSSEISLGLEYLCRLIDKLPGLQVIVLMGKNAQRVEKQLRGKLPEIRVVRCFHPSPLFVNRKKGNKRIIVSALHQVREILGDTIRPGQNTASAMP